MAKKKSPAKPSPKKKSLPLHGVKQLPVEWIVPENIRTLSPTNMVVQNGDQEYFVLFFELRPPVIIGTDVEKRAQFESTTEIPAVCVARLAIAKGRMKVFIDTLRENYERRMEVEKITSKGSGAKGPKR